MAFLFGSLHFSLFVLLFSLHPRLLQRKTKREEIKESAALLRKAIIKDWRFHGNTRKKVIALDLTGCRYIGELHERIRAAFDFPEWYGANLIAFDDFMETECDADEVVILGADGLPEELKEYLVKLTDMLDKVVGDRKYYSSLYPHVAPFSYRIERAV